MNDQKLNEVEARSTEIVEKPEKKVQLDKSTLNKSWFTWICFGQICYNYERMMGLGFTHSMNPIFRKLYPNDKEKRAEAMTRHLAFYNTENTWGAIINGIVASLEESRANGEEVTGEAISSLKTGLMGPLAGIGDSITQALVKVVLLAIAVDFALKGSPFGVILFVLLFSLYALLVSRTMFFQGYKLGKNSVLSLLQGSKTRSMTESLGVVGMMVLGALVSNNLRVATPLEFDIGGSVINIQAMLDQIIPKSLNIVAFLLVWYALKKGVKTNVVILLIFAAAIIFGLTGILA